MKLIVNWPKYLEKNPELYSWSNYWTFEDEKGPDVVARPHKRIYVGSYMAKIPEGAVAILNVAEETGHRLDAIGLFKYKVGLIDPMGDRPYAESFVKAVELAITLTSRHIVFIHCASGMNRSICVSATASAILDKTTVIEKIKLIAKTRPEIWPEPCYVIMGQILNGEFPNEGD